MTDLKNIRLEKTESTVSIIFQRDELNLLNIVMLDEISMVLQEISSTHDIKVCIFKSDSIAFCGGFDYSAENRDDFEKLIHAFHKTIRLLDKLECQTVSLLHGPALGAGFELASVCDFSLAVEGVKVGFPEIKKGYLPTVAIALASHGHYRKQLHELIMTGDTITAEEAKVFGMINHVYPKADFDTRCQEFIYRLTANPSQALNLVRGTIRVTKMIM
jgi:enoyl-CoA hydratase/carnithine racemase